MAEEIDKLTNEANRKDELQITDSEVALEGQKSPEQKPDGPTKRLERLRRLSSYLKALLVDPEKSEQQQLPVESSGQADISESMD